MRVAVIGADGVVGRGVAARLVTMGHRVVGVAPVRPVGWPGSVDFVRADPCDATALRDVITAADAIAHCAPGASLLEVAATARVGRIVLVSPVSDRRCRRVETMLDEAGADWVAIRCAVVLGRDVDDPLLARFAAPLVVDASDGSGMQVVHPEDVQRLAVRALVESDVPRGAVNLAAGGLVTVGDVAAAARRPCIRIPHRTASRAVVMDTSKLVQQWGYIPVWAATDCVEDFGLAVRGRLALGSRIIDLPWRLPRVRDVPAADVPASDGVSPVSAGLPEATGEFDTPIDPRFPAFVATNLSEALPGPFSPSSASVTVRGTKAAGMVIAQRLRPGGMVQREMAVRTTGVFGHRLYAGITSAHFMAETMPLVNSNTIVEGFFGTTAKELPIFGAQRPSAQPNGIGTLMRSVMRFGTNLIGLSAGAGLDTAAFIADVERLEALAADPRRVEDARLRALILLARDHVVHGWVLSSAALLVSTAYSVILRTLCGRDLNPAPGPGVASARSLGAMRRLAAEARADPAAAEILCCPGQLIGALEVLAPRFHAALLRELDVIGHRGPAEVEMRSAVYADDPERLARMVASALAGPDGTEPPRPTFPLLVRPIAHFGAGQLRDREERRDRMVRAIWVLRNMLREYGSRLVSSGSIDTVDDVFFLTVDELDAPPPDLMALVERRREQQRRLADLVPPEAFSGSWRSTGTANARLAAGDVLQGLGVCDGRAKGRVRIVSSATVDEVQPGEVLVAKVADVGYTPVFAYSAAVVTELGGPLSHAAIVAREFAVPCVVNARDATGRLTTGTLVEVDGSTGRITVLDE